MFKNISESKNNRNYILFFKYLLTVLILVLVYFQVDFSKAVSLVGQADLKLLFFPVFILGPLFYFLRILKWNILVRFVNQDNNTTTVTTSFFFGFILGIVTPGRLGEFARISGLKGDKYKLTSLVFFDRLLDLYAVVLLSLVSLTIFFPMHRPIFLFFILLYLITYFILPKKYSRLSRRLKDGGKLKQKFKRLLSIRSFLTPKLLVQMLYLTLLAYIIPPAQFFFIVNSFTQTPWTMSLIVPIAQLSNLIPITIGGFGVREGLFLILSQDFLVTKEVIVNSSVLWFVFNALIGITGYIFFKMTFYGKSKSATKPQ